MDQCTTAAPGLGDGDDLVAAGQQVVTQRRGKAEGAALVGRRAAAVQADAELASACAKADDTRSYGASTRGEGSESGGKATANDHSNSSPCSTARPPEGL